MNRPRVTLLVARAANGVIGRDKAMPWHLPEDLKHFRATTMGHPIVMGRRTFESIGRALPGRRTIVVSRDPQWQAPGVERAGSVDDAIRLAAGPGPEPAIDGSEIFVVGGSSIFAAAMARADRALVTELADAFDGDTVFPPLDASQWQCQQGEMCVSVNGMHYRIDEYRRR